MLPLSCHCMDWVTFGPHYHNFRSTLPKYDPSIQLVRKIHWIMIYPASTQKDVFEHKDSLETCKSVLLDSSEPCFSWTWKGVCCCARALKQKVNVQIWKVSLIIFIFCSLFKHCFCHEYLTLLFLLFLISWWPACLINILRILSTQWGVSHALPACNARAIVKFFFALKPHRAAHKISCSR